MVAWVQHNNGAALKAQYINSINKIRELIMSTVEEWSYYINNITYGLVEGQGEDS
jgi:hypothetical protein